MSVFVDLDLSLSNPDNEIDDELHSNVGTSEFNLDHDMFFVGAALEIWTAAGQTGTQLALTTDYTLHGKHESLSKRANRDVYQRIKIVNALYQSVDLYFTYWACADYISIGDLVTADEMVGVPIPWFENTIPDWALELDGSEISRTTYARLFSKYGEKYGNGDGSTTFNIPDLRGRFIRGWDHGAGRDPDAGTRNDRGDGTVGDNVGTVQSHAFQGHYHEITLNGGSTTASYICRGAGGNRGDESSTNEFITRYTLTVLLPTTGVHGTVQYSEETRPQNVNMMYITRY